MAIPDRIMKAAKSRIVAASDKIENSVKEIKNGTPLRAEPLQDRRVDRVAALTNVSPLTAARIVNHENPASLGLTGESLGRAEAIQGKTVDYLGVAWLEAGFLASKAVGRIIFAGGNPNGTGFLISDRLLITNNHVIPDSNSARNMLVEFRYELALGQRSPAPIRFALDPDTFFETDSRDDLDYTVIALGRALTPGGTVSGLGVCPLSDSAAKHSVGEPVNIVEHPDGDFKQVVVRENRIVHRGETVLHYLADTEPGASGSPVFNDQWQVVALHHWGGPHREVSAGGQPLSREVNEGIRISAIVKELRGREANMNAIQQNLWRRALETPLSPSEFGTRVVSVEFSSGPQNIVATSQMTSSATPVVALNLGVGEAGGAPANRIDRDYSNRRGYNSRFLAAFTVPMPQLNSEQRASAARVSGVGETGNPFELKYEHFSVVLNAERRMPFFSICNIDGAKRIRVDRDTGRAVSGPEATETWATDHRVPLNAQLSDEFYNRLRRDLRTNDFFARGHMTRREDPDWGTARSAEKANDDTFHHTNACPQMQNAFNGSQRVWQGIENFILNSADDANLRVTVITGPVFADNDPVYEDSEFGPIRIPRRFWKIVAHVEDGERKVFAVLADQSEAMDALFASRLEAREAAFVWPARLSTEFQSTVAEIARLTQLDFGDLANHDIFAGDEGERVPFSPHAIFPRRQVEGGFGKFPSIAAFLDKWQESQRDKLIVDTSEGAERRRRRNVVPSDTPRPPTVRRRKVVEVQAKVARVFADDLSGAKHQQFTVVMTSVISADTRAKADVQHTIDAALEVRLAVRFGDSMGLADRIPGIRSGVQLHLKGEWISADEANHVGGERIAVLHFTHDPLGFVCTPVKCFS